MRINYSEEENFIGQFELWQANCRRSMRGKAGQRELRELEAALLALPSKRLISGALTDDDGGVCAIACYAQHKGVDLSKFDEEDESDQAGIAAGMPRLVAWKVVEINDIVLDTVPTQELDGRYRSSYVTPEERYVKMLAWVRAQLKQE